ncbi:MAG: DUF2064 domain-containing protein [Chloroherpetonaceae bacterium]|nr:DUF2064 domain-containing protein [Chthonomonadaceae bacterium]MDW8206419.1 DUF2064 domain-containing protein [Chloroherpetonaceae bacterium]
MASTRPVILMVVGLEPFIRDAVMLQPEGELTEAACTLWERTASNVLRADCGELVFACPKGVMEAWLTERFPERARIVVQGRAPARRLMSVLNEAWRRRYQPCVLIGGSGGDIPAGYFQQAFDTLRPGTEAADVVLGPAADGSCYLLGLRWKEPALFTDPAQESPPVVRRLQERATMLGLRVYLLPEWPGNPVPP